MGFWIFMFLMDLLIPVMMIFVGKFVLSNPPKQINNICGYRTSMSMKNLDTWYFANRYCGKLWWKIGWVLLLPSVVVHLPFIHSDEGTIGIVGGIFCTVQCVILVGAIIPVERALKQSFDKNGKRK